MNGTWVNGYRLMTGQAKVLSDGDVIGITSDPDLILSAQIHQPQKAKKESAGAEDTQPLVDPFFLSLLYQLQKGSDVILLGVAGAGKTTLMRKLMPPNVGGGRQTLFERFWPEHRSLLFCRADGMAIGEATLPQFCRLLIATTKSAFPLGWPNEIRRSYDRLATPNCSTEEMRVALVSTIESVARHLNKRIVFLLDHFDDVYPKLPPELFWILQEVKTIRPHVTFVLAMHNQFDSSNRHIDKFLRVLSRPHDCWLPPLNDNQLKTVISPYKLSSKKMSQSIELGGYQPRLTELVALAIKKMRSVPADESSLSKKLLTNKAVADHLSLIWQSLLPEEQQALQSVASGQASMSESIQTQLTNNKGLLEGDDEEEPLRVQNPLFAAYVGSQTLTPPQKPSKPKSKPNLGSTVKDAQGQEIKIEGQAIPLQHLTAREEKLLGYMVGKAGQICTKDEIAQHIWGDKPNDPVRDESIATLISNLRKKLDQLSPGAGKRYIKTVRQRGYIAVLNESPMRDA
jgi:DNA-binding winged helix-turn-helix (wHTH) protein